MVTVRSGRRRRGWLAGIAVLVVGAVALAAWLVGARVRSAEQAAATAAPPPRSLVTAPVERRVLASTVVSRGDVMPAVSTAVLGPNPEGDDAAVVTATFAAVGDLVDEGDRVVEVSGRPVFVAQGSVPVFRSLRPGMAGRDVGQLQAALERLGCDGGDSGVFDEATTGCVAQLYSDAGYEVTLSSDTEVADIAEARSLVGEAEDTLEQAQAQLEAASQPSTPTGLLAAQVAVDSAGREFDGAVADQQSAIEDAERQVEDSIATLNAELVAANPAASAGAAAGSTAAGGAAEGVGGAQPAGAGAGGGGSVSSRDQAAAELIEGLDDVDAAVRDGEAGVAASEEALRLAQAELDALTAEPDVAAENLAVKQAGERLRQAETDLTDLEAVSGATVPFGELVFVPSLPARVDSLDAAVGASSAESGDPGGDAASGNSTGPTPLAVLSSAGLHVEVGVQPAASGLLRVGMEVELLDELSGVAVAGALTSMGTQPVADASGGGQSLPAVVEGVAELPAEWSGRNIRVTFTAAATDGEVLVVPLAAVSAAADARTTIEVAGDGGSTVEVEVEAGLSADGFVAVEPVQGAALDEGDRVVVGR